MSDFGRKTVSSLVWKLLERFGFHGIKMVIQIVLARILLPEQFGILSIMLVFTDFATIFVQSGLNTALIQRKNAEEKDFSSVFWMSLGIASILYLLLFYSAPFIASCYSDDSLSSYLRVMGVILFGGAYNSVQVAFASKKYDFKSQFKCNFIAIVVSGIVSIFLAYKGYGVWSLIVQQLLWQYISCVLLAISVKWYPRLQFDKNVIKPLFSFGWKMFASSLLIRMNSFITNLIVGKKFSTEALGYYTRAANFPIAFSDVVVNAISSVALVSFSDTQDNVLEGRMWLKRYVRYSYLFISPLMIGLACVAPALVIVLLTDKWISCVPYVVVFSIVYLFQPIRVIYGQAVSGVGRSDLYLRVFYIVKPISILLIVFCVAFFDSLMYVAIVVLVTQIFESFAQAKNVKKIFEISYFDQLKWWWPSVRNSIFMVPPVILVSYIPMQPIFTLFLQVIVGALVYYLFTYVTDRELVANILDIVKKVKKRKK